MPTRKTKTTLTDGTPIQKLATQFADLDRRHSELCLRNDTSRHGGDPKARRALHVLMREFDALKEQVLELQPKNLKDAAILAMVAFGAAYDADIDADRFEQESGIIFALRSILRVLVDESGLDLRDVGGLEFIYETPDLEVFPELDGPAAEAA
jgi:hypothetical protein